MAVPNEMTMLDTSGRYCMNSGLSDDLSEVLQLVPLSPVPHSAPSLSSLHFPPPRASKTAKGRHSKTSVG